VGEGFFEVKFTNLSLIQGVMSLLVLSDSDVNSITSTLSPQELMTLMASVFASLTVSQGVCSPHRTSIQTHNHKVLFMPSRIDSIGTAVKVVSVPTSAEAAPRGLPASTLMMDEVTGSVRAIVNAKNLTAIRTAAGEYCNVHMLHPRLLSEVLHSRIYSCHSSTWS
jgi:ornithine cyclodeaminase/alanine dehydrogenase-like protein (mu-crystallin family)